MDAIVKKALSHSTIVRPFYFYTRINCLNSPFPTRKIICNAITHSQKILWEIWWTMYKLHSSALKCRHWQGRGPRWTVKSAECVSCRIIIIIVKNCVLWQIKSSFSFICSPLTAKEKKIGLYRVRVDREDGWVHCKLVYLPFSIHVLHRVLFCRRGYQLQLFSDALAPHWIKYINLALKRTLKIWNLWCANATNYIYVYRKTVEFGRENKIFPSSLNTSMLEMAPRKD